MSTDVDTTKNSFETLSKSLDLDNIAKKILIGRRRILTDIKPDSVEHIKQIIEDVALPIHKQNAQEIAQLLLEYLGYQKICNREIQSSTETNNKTVVNYALSIVRDITGYTFGEDIDFVQKELKDADKVRELKSIYEEEDAFLEDQITAEFCSICGVGYECVLSSKDYDSGNPETGVTIGHLNPMYTFAVQSFDLKNPVILTATYYIPKDTGIMQMTIYTNDRKYSYDSETREVKDEGAHSNASNPITMFENNQFLLGDFEPIRTLTDALNQVTSDSVNDIENFVQSLLVFINAELGDDDETRESNRKKIKKNRMIEIKAPPGLTADAKYITQQLNPQNVTEVRDYLEEAIWKITGIPDRKTRSSGGGDTGDAVELRDGWADLEVVARNKERFFKKAKKEQMRNVLKILSLVNKNIQGLESKDVDINFIRNKRDNLATKTQAFATMMSTEAFDPKDALTIANLTTNVNEVVARGEKYWSNKYNDNDMQEQTIAIGEDENGRKQEDNNGQMQEEN